MTVNTLIMSQRRISDTVRFCLTYEFEDVIAEMNQAVRVDVTDFDGLDRSRKLYKLLRLSGGSPALAQKLAPPPREAVRLERDYDVFIATFHHLYDLYALRLLPDWRERCRTSCCYVSEVWSDKLPAYLIELLSGFDHIFLGTSHAVAEVARISGRPCTYLPLAVDVLRFAPASPVEPRPIMVSNIGRRSKVTHEALLAEADRQRFFYYYDTVAASGADRKQRTFRVADAGEHRELLGNLLKRSRYFLASRSYVNMPALTKGREEMSSRFYEGAAAGAVMLGEPPRGSVFEQDFDWPDAVIPMPFDSPDIGHILAELDANPARLRAARAANIREASRRHDWLHRLRVMFEVLDLPETDGMRQRAARLDRIASLSMAA